MEWSAQRLCRHHFFPPMQDCSAPDDIEHLLREFNPDELSFDEELFTHHNEGQGAPLFHGGNVKNHFYDIAPTRQALHSGVIPRRVDHTFNGT